MPNEAGGNVRARNIKPGFFRNEHLGELPHGTRLLFIGLWCCADREGRLEDRVARIRAEVFPYDDLLNADVNEMLDELARAGFITRYARGAAKYIQIRHFREHQHPHVAERASTIPPPDDDGPGTGVHHASTEQAPDKHSASTIQAQCSHGTSTVLARNEHGSRPSDSLIPDSLIEKMSPSDSCPEASSGPTLDALDPVGQSTPNDSSASLRSSSQVLVSSSRRATTRLDEQSPSGERISRLVSVATERADVACVLPCVGGEREFPVLKSDVVKWSATYPGVNVPAELSKMARWLEANPTRKKTGRGMPRFIVNWLAREQDRPKPAAPPTPFRRPTETFVPSEPRPEHTSADFEPLSLAERLADTLDNGSPRVHVWASIARRFHSQHPRIAPLLERYDAMRAAQLENGRA